MANVPNEKTVAAMKELEEGNGQRFDSVDALMADLNDANEPKLTPSGECDDSKGD